MAITAKVLQLGVPVVTAFHVTRMVFVVLVTGPMYAFLARRTQIPRSGIGFQSEKYDIGENNYMSL